MSDGETRRVMALLDFSETLKKRQAAIAFGLDFFASGIPALYGPPPSESEFQELRNMAMLTIQEGYPGGIEAFAAEFCERNPCLLCGAPSHGMSIFISSNPSYVAAPQGKSRSVYYSMCEECAALGLPAFEAAEAIIYTRLQNAAVDRKQ